MDFKKLVAFLAAHPGHCDAVAGAISAISNERAKFHPLTEEQKFAVLDRSVPVQKFKRRAGVVAPKVLEQIADQVERRVAALAPYEPPPPVDTKDVLGGTSGADTVLGQQGRHDNANEIPGADAA